MDKETAQMLNTLLTSQAQTAGTVHAALFAVQALLIHNRSPELLATLQRCLEKHYASMLHTAWPEQMNEAFESTRALLESSAGPED